MVLLAGILLLIPGFVTDILGLLLFLPPVREIAWRFLKSRIVVSAGSFGGFARPGARSGARASDRQRGGKTIDLDEDEYSSGPNAGPRPNSPWRGKSTATRFSAPGALYAFQFCALNGSSNTGFVMFPA